MCLPACCQRLIAFTQQHSFASPLQPAIVDPGAGTGVGDSLHTLRWHRVVDLTHTLDPDFPTYGGGSQFEAKVLATLGSDGWNYREWRVHEHTGTHFDAPLHRSNGLSADRVPAHALVGPLAVIDIRERAAANPDAQVTPADLRAWEGHFGPLPHGAIVAMNSGWSAHALTSRFRGADAAGVLHFPGFHPEATAFLLEERNVAGLVVDTLSLDHGPSAEFGTHTAWLGAGRWGLECAASLDDVPLHGATIIVGAPKVAGASGGPTRVFALA